MAITCDRDGANCKKFPSHTTPSNSNTILGLVLGSIALALVIIVIVIVFYILYCKRCRHRLRFRTRSSSTMPYEQSSTNINSDQRQPTSNLQTPSTESPPSYEDTKTNTNVRFE